MPLRSHLLAIFAATLAVAVVARAQDPGSDDLARVGRGASAAGSGVASPTVVAPGVASPGVTASGVTVPGVAAPGVTAPGVASPAASPLLTLPDGATIQAAFDREPALAAVVKGSDAPELRLFLWKFLPAEERDAVSHALAGATGSPTSTVPGLLAGADSYRWDREYVFTPEVQAVVRAAANLPESAFDPAGRIVPSAAVVKAQDAIARAVFGYYVARQQNPFGTQPSRFTIAPAAPVNDAGRRLDDAKMQAFEDAPVVLDAATRRSAAAAKVNPAALERAARREATRAANENREPVPVPGVAEAQRRLAWAKGVLEAHHLLDPKGASGLGILSGGGILDAQVYRALDTVQRYAGDGEGLSPGATFPRTTNAVRLLFGHKNLELMAIYGEVEKMMDTARKAIWVDLFYLGGAMTDAPGQDTTLAPNMGVRMLRYLQKRKAEGLEIRLLLSPRGTEFTEAKTYDAAVQTLGARSFNLAALPGGLPPRVDHDKLIVIDHGAAAMVGTINFDANGQGYGGHHETVALLRGPAAATLAWSHQANWRLAGGADSSGDDDAIRAAMAAEAPTAQGEEVSAPVWVTLTHPVVSNTTERLLDWIDGTGKGEDLRVWMFQFGDREVVAALARAVKRGVKLRMLADPYSGPVPQTSWLPNLAGFAPIQDEMAKTSGSAIHVLDRDASGTYLHSKVAVFGTDRFTLGSTNWTHVGLHRNAELSLFVESAPLAGKLIDRFEADWKLDSGDKAWFPALEAFRAKRPSYGNVDRQFLDRVARLMDAFF